MAQVTQAPGGRSSTRARAIVFIGFMGAGKSTAAIELARALGVTALDSDRMLEERFGRPLAEEFELGGETAFRTAEEQLVCELLDDAGRAEHQTVIALGGGSILSERVRRTLAPHLTVLLDVDVDAAWKRVSAAERGERTASSGAGLRDVPRDLCRASGTIRGAGRRFYAGACARRDAGNTRCPASTRGGGAWSSPGMGAQCVW